MPTLHKALKNVRHIAPTFYDVRYILGQLRKMQNIEGDFTEKNLPKINPFKIREMQKQVLTLINATEPYPNLYPGKDAPVIK